MKTIAMITAGIIFFATITIAIAEDWKAVTKDNEVISALDVKVERSELTQIEKQYTLRHLYKRKAILEADLAEINSLIAQIEPIVDEVKLKVKEVVE